MSEFNFDNLRNLAIGMVDFVSANEIKVLLETDAPQNTALNTGVPSLFPRINGFVLIPNEIGALVGIISWLGVEHLPYPKRKGFKDYDLIDLPFPSRKMSVNPIGTLKREVKERETIYVLERGVYSFPSIGDTVILPTEQQLKSIVENDDELAFVKIGKAPIAGNALVRINPNKLFGRHIAVLGNTGSGKSCSVAGLIRWSLEEAHKRLHNSETLNCRFIILDPNGEYSNSFDDLNTDVKHFKVEFSEEEKGKFQELRVPAWFWNSYEWSSFSQATGKTQRPILKRALRELKNSQALDDNSIKIKRYFSSCLASLRNDLNTGVSAFKEKPGRNDFGKKLQSFAKEARFFVEKTDGDVKGCLELISSELDKIAATKYKSFKSGAEIVHYFEGFDIEEVEHCIIAIKNLVEKMGGAKVYDGPDEDMPIEFDSELLPDHIELLALEQGVLQYLDFLIMRIRTMLSDSRMRSIISGNDSITLEKWLNDYVSGIVVIDLSLVPSDVLHLIVSVISRMTFEALQRYRRQNGNVLPTVLTLEEAHNFIIRHGENDEVSQTQICSQTFDKIAREGRKFGLSLMISSQRPSELSPTILSQCNTFLLHRIVNDRDQDLIKRMVPDNIGSLLKELPILPTRKAILLGWASSIPILVEMNDLAKKYRPKSDDPDFWEVWTGESERKNNWADIAAIWQGKEIPPKVAHDDSLQVNETQKKQTSA
jgi:uncharacterized protein